MVERGGDGSKAFVLGRIATGTVPLWTGNAEGFYDQLHRDDMERGKISEARESVSADRRGRNSSSPETTNDLRRLGTTDARQCSLRPLHHTSLSYPTYGCLSTVCSLDPASGISERKPYPLTPVVLDGVTYIA